jgi:hypothetical protein
MHKKIDFAQRIQNSISDRIDAVAPCGMRL